MVQIQAAAAAAFASLRQDEARAVRTDGQSGIEIDEIVADAAAAAAVESAPAESDERPGVLRLLQAGHFKGVADVRLRIVHADKIAALEAEQARSDVTDASALLTSSVSATVTELAEASESVSTEQASAAIVAFGDQVGAAIDTAFTANGADAGALETALTAAFQALVDDLGLRTIADDVTTEAVATVGSDQPSPDATEGAGRDFLAELNEIFSAELARILASAATDSTLPPISEASGNGRAFERFLAMYDEIQNAGNVPAEPATVEVVA